MRPGHINKFAYLSRFKSVQEFNKTIKHFIDTYSKEFTKSQKLAFQTLTQYSIKIIGVCNARICQLVKATHKHNEGGISRSTFERMLQKAKKLGILSIISTTRKNGGTSHNVYIFQPFDGAPTKQLTERNCPEIPPQTHTAVAVEPQVTGQESLKEVENFTKEKNKKTIQELSPKTLEELDYTYVPSYVPEQFIKTVKPFFTRATEICQLWDRALMAYRSRKIRDPIGWFLPLIIKAFKETVYKYKQNRIKTSFVQYFFGAVYGILAVERRTIDHNTRVQKWLK
ncbi:hypothetical protein DS745_21570 [Anaerobacillus alkaliphilus]|uniref:Helix-turn-helix domain-containing protein n=1 Tax=Anaerobacillus alkaliphilus TaxID=1548597 RepID=A0A4Q0VPQ2_9BACI|nr:hypothetical protein [Anaerobacillus alkaliphilus]RXI96315.1 hypothetical protein DS745_21570 [Anaerobacillus alkaliphilus]